MDFAIEFNAGQADMTWDPVEDISNNIWLSLNVKKGTLFSAPEFGSRLHLIEKNTPQAPALAEAYAKEALKWLLDIGRAKSIDVTAEQDMENHPNRLILRGVVEQANGSRVPFEQFVEVV